MGVVDERFVNAICEELCRVASNPTSVVDRSTRFRQLEWDSPRFGYADSETTEADRTIDKITKRFKTLSRYLIETAVERCLAIVKKDGKSSQTIAAVKKIIEGLNHASRDHTVFLPIAGLALDDPEVSAGPVTIVKLSGADIQKFLSAIDQEESVARKTAQKVTGNLRRICLPGLTNRQLRWILEM